LTSWCRDPVTGVGKGLWEAGFSPRHQIWGYSSTAWRRALKQLIRFLWRPKRDHITGPQGKIVKSSPNKLERALLFRLRGIPIKATTMVYQVPIAPMFPPATRPRHEHGPVENLDRWAMGCGLDWTGGVRLGKLRQPSWAGLFYFEARTVAAKTRLCVASSPSDLKSDNGVQVFFEITACGRLPLVPKSLVHRSRSTSPFFQPTHCARSAYNVFLGREKLLCPRPTSLRVPCPFSVRREADVSPLPL